MSKPIEEKWGKFPPVERQDQLKKMLEAWEQESDHKGRAGPFAAVKLTGADVYWLAALAAGAGDVSAGKKKLGSDSALYLTFPSLHLEGATLGGAHLST